MDTRDHTNIKSFLKESVDEFIEEAQFKPVELLLPILKQYGMINRTITADEVSLTDLKELCIRWNVKIKDPKTRKDRSFNELIHSLLAHMENSASTLPGSPKKSVGFESYSTREATAKEGGILLNRSQSAEQLAARKKMRIPNYFGLPTQAYDTNSTALVYQARKEVKIPESRKGHREEHHDHVEHVKHVDSGPSTDQDEKKVNKNMVAAQRKVSHALLTMVENESMAPHFMMKGGVEAVIKLLGESTDIDVLSTCMKCLITASAVPEYCKVLTDKYILSTLSGLLDKADQDIALLIAKVTTNLTYQEPLGNVLVLGGVVSIVQGLFQIAHQHSVFFYLMVTMNNIAPCLTGPDAELALKILMSCTKRIDVARYYENCIFAIDVFVNMTRILHYSIPLCEEGVLPLFIHALEMYLTVDMMGRIAEGFVNLSCTRKNRREIASSGIASHLDKIFTVGAPSMRAHILSMVGNLLTSGFFHDKIARDDAILPMLNEMLDPKQPSQFTAVAYVISQLATVETSSIVMVRCNVIPIILGLLREAPDSATNYLWTLLAALSQQPRFFEDMVKQRLLVLEMYKEVLDTNSTQIELVVQLAYNLSLCKTLHNWFEQDLCEMFVELLKRIFAQRSYACKATAMSTLINFCTYARSSRITLLGMAPSAREQSSSGSGAAAPLNIIDLFETVGIEDPVMNVKYLAVLNIISNEENLCIRLLEAGAQKFMVSVQGSLTALTPLPSAKSGESKSSVGTQGITGELGRALTAATLHNLALKRSTLGPGVLISIMSMLRNNKSLRILHCVRTLARASVHPKSKIALTREKRLIPQLTALMRSGCEEADRVQHYCALAICNTLASNVPKEIMEELMSSGAVTDLLVCTLLRINSIYTKESLGKGLFNLMTRVEFRNEMVCKLDVLTAMVELAKIENIELLELCMRAVYNITCETKEYAEKIKELKIANILIARVTLSPTILGAKATTAVKLLCGMSLANLSMDHGLAEEMLFDKRLADACYAVFNLQSDESTYCASAVLCNLSMLDEAKNLADSCAIPLLVEIIARGPVSCIQMAVVTLCNFSMHPAFYDQLTEVSAAGKGAFPSLVTVLSAPSMHEKVKKDALQTLYNVITNHPASWPVAVDAEVLMAMSKLVKAPGSTDDENMPTCTRVARIVKELCQVSGEERLLKKMLADGVMQTILKLAKPEQPALKFDVSCAMYSLSQSADPRKVLQWNGVDTLYWLTVHDCLSFNVPIHKNVSRALRNFSAAGTAGQGAVDLAKEERTMTVMRALTAGNNEDVQWQVSGAVYNMLGVKEAQELILTLGVVGLLLDLAAAGHTSVRHVCSACLHMCPPENMPDLSDPAALSLVLCLLEVDGEKFGELAEMSRDAVPYILDMVCKRSAFEMDPTGFVGTWVTINCDVDTVFSSALVAFPEGTYKEVPPQRPSSSTLSLSDNHHFFNGSEFFFGSGGEVPMPALLRRRSLDGRGGDTLPQIGDGTTRSGGETDLGASDQRVGMEDGAQSPTHDFAPPIGSEEIAYPKIFSKTEVPRDTVGAIRNSNARASQNADRNVFPQRLHEESVATNSHMNASMPQNMGAALKSTKSRK